MLVDLDEVEVPGAIRDGGIGAKSLILRRLASSLTSFMTSSAPVPVPITSCRHFHGILSSADSGVWPKTLRNFLDGFFSLMPTSPRSITSSCSYVTPSMRIEPKENSSKRLGTSGDYGSTARDGLSAGSMTLRNTMQ